MSQNATSILFCQIAASRCVLVGLLTAVLLRHRPITAIGANNLAEIGHRKFSGADAFAPVWLFVIRDCARHRRCLGIPWRDCARQRGCLRISSLRSLLSAQGPQVPGSSPEGPLQSIEWHRGPTALWYFFAERVLRERALDAPFNKKAPQLRCDAIPLCGE